MSPRSTADVVVVGSGIVGAAAAAELATRGADVLVIDKERAPAAEASGRAQGVIRIQGRDPAEIPLAREAAKRWHVLEGSSDIELVFGGNLYFCAGEDERRELEDNVREAHEAGLDDVRLLEPSEVREIVPSATGPFAAAMWSPQDGHCDPAAATRHLADAATCAGARMSFGSTVTRLAIAGERVVGVETTTGTVTCGAVAVCGGVWTPHLLSTAGIRVPVMPVALSEGETSPLPPLFAPALRAVGFGGRQRPDGRIVFSAGLEATVDHGVSLYDLRDLSTWLPRFTRFRRDVRLHLDVPAIRRQLRARSAISPRTIPIGVVPPPRPAALDAAHEAMARVIPAVEHSSIRRRWAGIVDMSPDGLPTIDAAGPAGLAFVTGLSGHGFALGPVLGEIVADLVTEGSTRHRIDPFRSSRFTDSVPIARKAI